MVAIGGPKSVTDAVRSVGGQVGPRLKWLGSWNLHSGIGDWDAFFAGCKADGITPEIYWFAWGDFISPSAITNGVSDTQQGGVFKTRGNLMPLLVGVMAKAKAAGVQPFVILEGEFNKNGCEHSPEFAAWWDSCEAVIRTCPGAKVVFAMGAWGDIAAVVNYYAPQVAKSDYLGLQCGYFKPRNPTADITTVGQRLRDAFAKMGTSKPHILYDCFISTYGGAYATSKPFGGGDGRALEAQQATAIASLAVIPNLAAIVYRDLKDNPNVGLGQYGGYAERFVGVVRSDGTQKPGYAALMALSKGAVVTPPPVPVPAPVNYTSEQYNALKAQLDIASGQLASTQTALAAANSTLAAYRIEADTATAKLASLRQAVTAAVEASK